VITLYRQCDVRYAFLWASARQPEGRWHAPDGEVPQARPDLDDATMLGDRDSYPACQIEAERIRELGHEGLVAPSAALRGGAARPWRAVGEANVPAGERAANVVVLFGPRPDLDGWLMVDRGAPPSHVLERVRHFGES
jgi:hypothetical protein